MIASRALVASAIAVFLLGAVAPSARAQSDLSGTWAARNHEDGIERSGGPFLMDLLGIPVNEEARARALSLSSTLYAMIERQCALWPPHYIVFGPQSYKIWNDTDPVTGATTAWQIGAIEDRFGTTIWMDGRPRPSPNAYHERGGFTTGEWNGDTLTTYTTDFKGGWIRRSAAPSSERASMTTHYIRHGDLLTVVAMVEDPIYLTETLTASKNYQLDTANTTRSIGPVCVASDEGGPPEGKVPHYLPGKNPDVADLMRIYHIPTEASLGGAETMYPEFRKKIKDLYVRPEKCLAMCGGPAPAAPPPPAPPAAAAPSTPSR